MIYLNKYSWAWELIFALGKNLEVYYYLSEFESYFKIFLL